MSKRLPLLLLLSVAISGCTSAPPVAPAVVQKIQVGMTMDEVRSHLGQPADVEPRSTFGGPIWEYSSLAPGHNPHRVAFDGTGRVAQVVVVSTDK